MRSGSRTRARNANTGTRAVPLADNTQQGRDCDATKE